MGIPKFFRWLTRRYPLILQNIKREEDCPPVDNLYLDLNGIVHNCIHGNDLKRHEHISKLEDFEEVWVQIMLAIDELVHVVKPRKLLFLAVDGVAPRAKMNQQRARRFRSAKDAMALRESLIKQGKDAPELFDSNAISPGTKFMNELNKNLAFFVQYKLNTDPNYQKLNDIVLSDGSVPGEGEHKMLDYIRQLKLKDNYDPNTRHCFYGADADLIMLSLITHEPHFTIIREEHLVRKIKQGGIQRIEMQRTKNFQMLHISLLREYFQLEYKELESGMKMKFNIERIIDDFAFFCFFIGNDFLPSLTTLDIGEGALDTLVKYYKKCLKEGLLDDYITDSGKIYWSRAQTFIKLLGHQEQDTMIGRIEEIHSKMSQGTILSNFDEDVLGIIKMKKDKTTVLKEKIRYKLRVKKLKKIENLKKKPNGDKKYKKFLLLKKYSEDQSQINTSEVFLQSKNNLMMKYSEVKKKQQEEHSAKSEGEAQQQKEEEKQVETLVDILNSIKEEFFSELDPDEIPDDEVSDINEEDLQVEDLPLAGVEGQQEDQQEIENNFENQKVMTEKYQEENFEFMINFVKMYNQDKNKAKQMFYSCKLKFDISTEDGEKEKKRMLKKYLEGLQWVLYYYYKGAQHWRWYYPYHYAPLISDLGTNIVQNFLNGQECIDVFEEDTNCTNENYPYTPFQQLLSILPIKSLKLMPSCYSEIILGELKKYFPQDFEIDLNGRTLPWEAVCLIPFIDEELFLKAESELMKSNSYTDIEKERNIIHFTYYSYKYQKNKENPGVLESTLKSFQSLNQNFVQRSIHQEYQDVGKYSFQPEIHPRAILPALDLPSFKWLNVKEIEYDTIVFNKVSFERVLIKIPKVPEVEENTEKLEQYVHSFLKQIVKEVYTNFPFQIEAFPTVFEDSKFTYTLFGDVYSGFFKIHKEQQKSNDEVFLQRRKRIMYKYQNQGFKLDDTFQVIVSVTELQGVAYDSSTKSCYKTYEEKPFTLPLGLLMKKRDPRHYLNMNSRIQNLALNIKTQQQVVCLNLHLFGVVGEVDLVDFQKHQAKVVFNKQKEEAKIHDPFIAHNCLSNQQYVNRGAIKKYVHDRIIEDKMKLKYGVVNRLTGSVLVSYNDPETFEKQVLDLGLNLKNFTKKVHIPDYVRFVNSEDVADYQHDSYTHNTHARGASHVRKYFEYSEECVKLIQQYYMLFPEVFEFITQEIKKQDKRKAYQNKPLNTLKDIFPTLNQNEAILKVKTITKWLEELPFANLPYVEMGFDALAHDLIQKIDNQLQTVRESFEQIKIQCRPFEFLKIELLYQESFPFWTPPYSLKNVKDFNVGDRIMNVNSTLREYIPFGLRGTVIGKTNDKVIVIFDEQFLQGNNIQGHCTPYKGAYVNPHYLLNLTRKFSSIMKQNLQLVQKFIEQQPLAGGQEQQQEQSVRQVMYKPKQPIHQSQEEEKSVVQEQNQDQINQMLDQLIAKSQSSGVEEEYYDEEVQQQEQQPLFQQEESSLNIDQSPFVPNIGILEGNPDFQQLLNLMNFANQMQAPLPSQQLSGQQQDRKEDDHQNDKKDQSGQNLNINASSFVPAWKKN